MKRRNKTRTGDVAIWVMLIGVILLVLIGYRVAYSGDAGWGYSWESVYWPGSYWHDTECDSGYILFGYPDSTNYYDTVDLVPSEFDSAELLFLNLDLDSIGEHQITVVYYERGSATSGSKGGSWTHLNAVRGLTITAPSSANICRVYGYLSDIGTTGIENVRVTATLPSDTYDSCSNMIIFNRVKTTRSYGASGYFFIDLIYSSCLSDEKYTFKFEKRHFEGFEKIITVPDSATHYIQWGD